MDRSYAIKRIKEMQRLYSFTPAIQEALDLAIEALSEPTISEKESVEGDTESATSTNVDGYRVEARSISKLDCISRQQAIEAVEKRNLFLAYQGEKIKDNMGDFVGSIVEQVRSRIKKNIESLPPVTPTNKVQQADTLIIAAALWYFAQDSERNIPDRERAEELRAQVLAPVTPTERTEWIPVSERLPENNGRYLVSYEGIIGMRTNILHYGVPSPLHTRGAEKCFYNTDREYGDVPYEDVIAWQPLPDPYKGGDTE